MCPQPDLNFKNLYTTYHEKESTQFCNETGGNSESLLLCVNRWKGCIFNISPCPCSLKGTAVSYAPVNLWRANTLSTHIYIYIHTFSWCTFSPQSDSQWEQQRIQLRILDGLWSRAKVRDRQRVSWKYATLDDNVREQCVEKIRGKSKS